MASASGITKIMIVMKKSIAKAALGTVIMLAIVWVGCESTDGTMSWGFVLGKIIALAVVGVCGYLLDLIYKSEKKCGR